jgi:hypothetical protein
MDVGENLTGSRQDPVFGNQIINMWFKLNEGKYFNLYA